MARPRVPPATLLRIEGVLASGQLVNGACVREFEEGLSQRVGGRSAVAVSSGTEASYLAFLMLRRRGYRRAILPAFSFPSVASAATLAGFEVALVDIEPERLTPRPSHVADVGEGAVVMTVDSFGIPGWLAEWGAWHRSGAGYWLEDAACGLGAGEGELVCCEGSGLAFLSFHPRKVLTTGEGGAVVCSEGDAADFRVIRNLGMEVEAGERRFVSHGVNARMSELHAAVGLGQLSLFDEILERRRSLGHRYMELLGALPGVEIPGGYSTTRANFQSMVVRLKDWRRRPFVIAGFAAAGIESTVAGFFLPSEPAFSGLAVLGSVDHSRQLGLDGLALPIHDGMTDTDVDEVVATLAPLL